VQGSEEMGFAYGARQNLSQVTRRGRDCKFSIAQAPSRASAQEGRNEKRGEPKLPPLLVQP